MFERQNICIPVEPQPSHIIRRNLGGAIILEAIRAYRGKNDAEHYEAAELLYPRTESQRIHWAWVMSEAHPINELWLRSMLDKFRGQWDAERRRKQ